jgi:hypothetical protein
MLVVMAHLPDYFGKLKSRPLERGRPIVIFVDLQDQAARSKAKRLLSNNISTFSIGRSGVNVKRMIILHLNDLQ